MKGILSCLSVVSTSCVFPFWKMEESGIFKRSDSEIAYLSKINETDFKSLYNALISDGSDSVLAYIYDCYSKYGLNVVNNPHWPRFCNDHSLNYEQGLNYLSWASNFLTNRKYSNLQAAKKSFNSLISENQHLDIFHPKAFVVNIEKDLKGVFSIRNFIQKFADPYKIPLKNFRIKDFKWSREYVSASGITVKNTTEGVKLSKTLEDGKEQTIDFQPALSNYVQKRCFGYGSQLFEDVLRFKMELENSDKIKISTKNIVNILHGSKMIFSEKEKDLFKNSEILAVWYLVPTRLINKKDKEIKPKIINRMLIGFGFDKRDNTTFHWVTDLGDDISILFDM